MTVSSSGREGDLSARLGLWTELTAAPGVILFDGRCRFCRFIVRSLLEGQPELRVCSVHTARGRALAEALGRAAADTFAFLTAQKAYFDVDAYVTVLTRHSPTRWLGRCIAVVPNAASGAIYRWVANHRPLLSSLLPQRWPTTIDADKFIPGGAES
jgi:predicted DCC family thiol-disulfide oxidoreductase YuxK